MQYVEIRALMDELLSRIGKSIGMPIVREWYVDDAPGLHKLFFQESKASNMFFLFEDVDRLMLFSREVIFNQYVLGPGGLPIGKKDLCTYMSLHLESISLRGASIYAVDNSRKSILVWPKNTSIDEMKVLLDLNGV